MEKKTNWQEYKAILEQHGIKKLYHFTDRDNLESIIRNGGLYSWADCDSKGIKIENRWKSNIQNSGFTRWATEFCTCEFRHTASYDVCCYERWTYFKSYHS